MNQYHKIYGPFKRDQETKKIVEGNWYTPEFAALADTPIWYLTEKVDGTNIRIKWDGNRVSFAGKSDNAQIPPRLLEHLEQKFGGEVNETFFEEIFGEQPACLYGEGFGSKIQSGGDYFPDSETGRNEFALFDISINDIWLERENVCDIGYKLSCDWVEKSPDIASLNYWIQLMKTDCKDEKIPTSNWGSVKEIEGWVARTDPELRDRRGNRIICKLKYNDFKAIV